MNRVVDALAGHVRAVVVSLLVVTAGLSYPLLYWPPDETASQSPVTEITATQDLIGERFANAVFDYLLLVEATDGDILDKEPLLALLENSADLRADPQLDEYVVTVDNPDLGFEVDGIWTIADSVDRLLRGLGIAGGLETASEQQVDEAVAALLGAGDPLDWGLAIQTAQDDAGVWHSPALFAVVTADNDELGGGGFLVTIGTDTLDKEYLARDLVAILRGDGAQLDVWAPAADVNLTSNEQGELAGPFIGATIAAVLLIVGIAFRSYWAVAISGAALAILMVWLQGGANLVGLKSDQILSTILPISIISFGIDSAFHGIGRVREHRREGHLGRQAFVLGITSVLAALALAATSDMAAFLSNTASGIESIIQFGFAAAISTAGAFILLGIATPLLLTEIEERTGERTITRLGIGGDLVLSLFAAAMATATVLVLVFVSPETGLVLLAGYVGATLVLPYLIARRGRGRPWATTTDGSGSRTLGAAVAGVASRPLLTVGIAALITAGAGWAALRLDVTFDVKDFFSPESDFVVALDKTATYLGDQGGEPALVYVEGDLADPASLEAMMTFVTSVGATPDNPLAVGSDGEVRVEAGVLDLAAAGVETTGGLDNADDLSVFFDRALGEGVTDRSGTLRYDPGDVATMLWRAENGASYATVLTYQIPDTRNQENIVRAREILEPAGEALEAALEVIEPDSRVVVTGSAVYRDDQLAGIRRALLLALPIAVVSCFVVAAAFMRSLRYALVGVVPILLVVTWLYGIMYVAGYSINVVTSIIGAVSIGIGIDFSTHYAMRFLEERKRGLDMPTAFAAAGSGTGSALFGSATTSVAGFAALAFAPMPMFASYGLLTAVMIVLALVASLFVLPSLLALATPGDGKRRRPRAVSIRPGDKPVRIGVAGDVSDLVDGCVRKEFDAELRNATVMVNRFAVDVVPELVSSGAIDLGLVVVWPGGPAGVPTDARPVFQEELVAVGGDRHTGVAVPVEHLAHRLVVGGPAASRERCLAEPASRHLPPTAGEDRSRRGDGAPAGGGHQGHNGAAQVGGSDGRVTSGASNRP